MFEGVFHFFGDSNTQSAVLSRVSLGFAGLQKEDIMFKADNRADLHGLEGKQK